jgi:hypothetical protein
MLKLQLGTANINLRINFMTHFLNVKDPSDSIDSNSIDKPNSSAGSSTTSSGLDMSPLDCVGGTKCPVCGSTFSNPKVLLCFHTFCGDCLKKIVDEVLYCLRCMLNNTLALKENLV